MIRSLYIFPIFLAVIVQSCGSSQNKSTQQQHTNIQSKEFQDKLIEANRMSVKRESDEIDQYVKHKGWNMITTGTGLRYMITRKGTGEAAVKDSAYKKYATIKFLVSLLDGTVCYSSDSTG